MAKKGKYNKIRMRNKLNDKGSALIVCIIVLLFVSILATVILYMSGVNYRMKKTDYRTRLAFYDSEMYLERMQSNLIVPVSEAVNNAMLTANSYYAFQGGVNNCREFYYDRFEYELKTILLDQYGGASIGDSGRAIDDSTVIKNMLHNLTLADTLTDVSDGVGGIALDHIFLNDGSVIGDNSDYHDNPLLFINDLSQVEESPGHKYFSQDGTYLVVTSYVGQGIDAMHPTPALDNVNAFIVLDVRESGALKSDLSKCRVLFKNLCVVTVKDGYKSVISTDLAVTIPMFDFSGGSSYGNWNIYQLMYYTNWQKI